MNIGGGAGQARELQIAEEFEKILRQHGLERQFRSCFAVILRHDPAARPVEIGIRLLKHVYTKGPDGKFKQDGLYLVLPNEIPLDRQTQILTDAFSKMCRENPEILMEGL